MGFWGWCFVIVAIIIVGVVVQISIVSGKQKAMEERLKTLPDFSPTQKVMGNNGNSGLAVDDARKKICLIKNDFSGISLSAFLYRDILSSEIFVDGETVTKTARGSQIGRALIGGIAFGGVGAIIGGLSGKTIASEKVKRIDLRITINDLTNPLHEICFMEFEGKKDSFIYKAAMDQARHWHGVISVLIKHADAQDGAETKSDLNESIEYTSNRSIADELTKLADLRDRGLLTDEEFLAQKQKLLC